ncbi:MAG TPA: cytochrome c3 family protein [Acidobacteriota bacterium]|nr:cytochrome c3 family protein [Acidobacteriota bacterium]
MAIAQDDQAKPADTSVPVQQPIPFSHRIHSSLQLECATCHPGATEKASAGLPKAADCLQCHRSMANQSPFIQELMTADLNNPIEWVRIYELPYFVFFSHASHSQAEVECHVCHGEVEQQDVLTRQREMTMLFCVDCHKDEQASTECNFCHELNQ